MMNVNKRAKKKIKESNGTEQEVLNGNKLSKKIKNTQTSRISKCCSWFKYVILVLLLPPFLNFAAINQEQRFLIVSETLYENGNGQKLSFKCEGTGKPTGYFTNHSLRASAATRLFNEGVDEQLICEQTGHRSSAVRAYKRTSLDQKEKVSDIVNGNVEIKVLLEAPTGWSSDIWGLIVPTLSELTKVCVYDRAGLGFSDRPYRNITVEDTTENSDGDKKMAQRWQSFTVESMVDDLFNLITYRSQQVEKPFILVGSELGALIARFYTQLYESDVSELVLIDPLPENLFEEDGGLWSEYWFNHIIPTYQTMQLAAATGVTRIALMAGLMDVPLSNTGMENEILMKQKHLMCHPRHLSSVVDEHHFINESFSQMQTVFMMKTFPSNVSVTVITGNYYDEELPNTLNEAWRKSQDRLLSRIHPQSNRIVINGADRKMIYKKPEHILEQIKKLVLKQRRQVKRTEKS